MLVIPVEKQIDWRHPPWVTLMIIALNVLIFWLYQGNDEEILSNAVSDYRQSGLYQMEKSVYADYLEREIRLNNDARTTLAKAVREALNTGKDSWLPTVILVDRVFYEMLLKEGALFWSSRDYAFWQQARPRLLTEYMDQLSSYRSGLQPAHLQVSDLISYQFLHGDEWHLISNMVLLLIVGLAIESAFGGGRYLLAYLFCGVCAGLFYSVFNLSNGQPLIGASGSISGLMGLYVSLYQLQRIRFFYFVGVYFNYFKAPALILLPYWFAKEIYEYLAFDNRHIAYLAHIGGLLTGVALYAAFGRSWLKAQASFYAPDEGQQDLAFREAYSKALAPLSQFDFVSARKRFRELAITWPEHPGIRLHLYHLEKTVPESTEYQQIAQLVIQQLLANEDYESLADIYPDYAKRSGRKATMPVEEHVKVLYGALKHNAYGLAELVFSQLQIYASADMQQEAALLLVQEFKRHGQQPRLKKYQEFLDSRS